MSDKDYVWAEAFRPHTVKDCILPEHLKSYFQAMVDRGQIDNMTLIGGPGTGKTTVARAVCEELGIDHIVINASENGNIDTIRTTVRQFASTVSFKGGIKCIIMDEGDYLTAAAQAALRGAIEEFSKNCRFIFTGNFGNRYIEAIISRAPVVEFAFTKEERRGLMLAFLDRVDSVLTQKGVEFNPSELAAVVKKHFPDYRRTWNLLQRYCSTGVLQINSQVGLTDDALKELVDYLKDRDFGGLRRWTVDHLDNDGGALRRAFYEKVMPLLQSSSIPQLVLILAEYDYKEAHVMDKEINAVAMLTTIMAECQFK